MTAATVNFSTDQNRIKRFLLQSQEIFKEEKEENPMLSTIRQSGLNNTCNAIKKQ